MRRFITKDQAYCRANSQGDRKNNIVPKSAGSKSLSIANDVE